MFFKVKSLKKSVTQKLRIKGRIRSLFNIFGILKSSKIQRMSLIKINEKIFSRSIDFISEDFDIEKELLIASPIWRPILEINLNNIKESIEKKSYQSLKTLYENLFLSDFMSGAVSHGKNISWITRLTLGTRFYYWEKQLNKIFSTKDSEIISLINKSINTDIYNYGRPLICHESNRYNIECLDEIYFSLFIFDIISLKKFDEILFLGDGAGLLAPIIIDLNHFLLKGFQCKYRIVDFCHFSIATLLRIDAEKKINLEVTLPEKIHQFHSGKITPGKLPKCSGNRLIINQDSFPEMSEISLKTYLTNTAFSTDVISYNQDNLEKGHSKYMDIINNLGYECSYINSSLMRDNYIISYHQI